MRLVSPTARKGRGIFFAFYSRSCRYIPPGILCRAAAALQTSSLLWSNINTLPVAAIAACRPGHLVALTHLAALTNLAALTGLVALTGRHYESQKGLSPGCFVEMPLRSEMKGRRAVWGMVAAIKNPGLAGGWCTAALIAVCLRVFRAGRRSGSLVRRAVTSG